MESAPKRRRVERSLSPTYKLDDEDDSFEQYIPVSQRRQQKLAKLTSWGTTNEKQRARKQQEEIDEREDAQKEEELRREKARMERTLLMEAQEVHSKKAVEGARQLDIYELSSSWCNRFEENRERKGRRSRRRDFGSYKEQKKACL